jgi:penicillin amidase
LRRAAAASLPLVSPRARSILQAYSDGLNAYVSSHPLPPEYHALELSKFQPWTPTDSLVVLKLLSFGQSFSTDIPQTIDLLTFQQVGNAAGFDGTKLFFEDIVRSAPFDPASTVPDALGPSASGLTDIRTVKANASYLRSSTLALAKDYLHNTESVPLLRQVREQRSEGASNEWAISGALSLSGAPLLANDPHLSLGAPATWYPIHIQGGEFDVIGVSLPGAPLVSLGHNHFVSWGITNSEFDVTDTFQEQVVPDSTSPSGLSTVFQGNLEHVIPIPEVFRQNIVGDGTLDNIITVRAGGSVPAATLIVPRRNNGPIISLDLSTGSALSIQWTGSSGSREIDADLLWNTARNLEDFRRSLPFWTSPPFNLAYSDVHNNIAYFAIGAVPVREDLQAGNVTGLPPIFVRNGGGGNEWLPVTHPQQNQTLPYEILPAPEMPHLVNPPAGFFVNANNDPVGVSLANNSLGRLRPGGGIYYLGYLFDSGFRAGRINELIREKLAHGKLSFVDMQEIQADVIMRDAEFFTPFITAAYDRALSTSNQQLAQLAAAPEVSEAIGRLRHWDFSTPSGIPEGYDAGDRSGPPFAHSDVEITNSVAATLYSVWRGRFASNTIDASLSQFGISPQTLAVDDEIYLSALRNLMETFPTRQGRGTSGVNFFQVSGMNASESRDFVILKSLRDALTMLCGPGFADAFGNSANQRDYRWGSCIASSLVISSEHHSAFLPLAEPSRNPLPASREFRRMGAMPQ